MTDEVAIARLRQGLYRFFGGALIAPDEERLAVFGSEGKGVSC